MPLFSPRFRNKVMQMTYKPMQKKKAAPSKMLDGFGKSIEESIEALFFEKGKDDEKEEKSDEKD